MNFSPHPVSLRQLQYIVALADLLSFNRAADECHVSQPSLSAQIAELERVLGVRLFERDHRRVALTVAGRDFVERTCACGALASRCRRARLGLSGARNRPWRRRCVSSRRLCVKLIRND